VAYRPIAWVVSSLFVLAPLVFADAARAQSAVGLRSHVPFTEWAGHTPAAPAQVKVDEQKRAAEIDTAEGQARLAAEAKRAEEARQRQRAEEQAKLVREAQAREVQRMAEEAARLEAARAKALAKQKADEERAAAEKRRQQEQARAAETARAEAIAKQQAEAERTAAERRHQEELARAVEAARAAAEKAAADARRLDAEQRAEERRKAAAQVAAMEAAHRAEAERAAAAEARAQQAEDQRREIETRAAAARAAQAHAEAERKAEAERARAEAAKQAEDQRRAEAEKAAAAVAAQAKAEAARQNQSEHLPAQHSDDSLVEFKAVVPTGTVPAVHQEVRTVAPQDKPRPSLASVASPPETPSQSANAPLAAVERPKTRHGKASAVPTKGTPGQFAQWLEAQSDDYGTGPTPSPEKLREIFWQAVQMAAERSPEVRQAYAGYQAANADVAEAKGQRWPQVDIGAQSPGVNFGPGDSGDGGNAGNPLSVSVTTNLFDWGRTKNTIGSREHLSTAANRAYDAALEKAAFDVSANLIELGKQRNIVDLSQQFVDRMATLVKMLGEIVEVDRGRGSELTQAKTRLLQAQASRDTAEARARDAELTLRKLVGDEAVMIPRTRVWSVEPGDLQKLLSLVGAHPSLQQAKAEADAADMNAKAVKASGLPQVNWVVSAGMSKDALGRRQPWQTMLNLNWGAFRGGSAKAATEAAGARAEASWQRLEQQRRDLEYAVRTADQDAHTMLQRADLYQGLSVETDRVRKAFFEQWHHLGRRTLLDVLTAENEHYGNRVAEVTNRFDGYLAVFREHYSAGGLAQWLRNEHGQ
jgi:adhesin transport system outer membrane protein